MKRRKMDGPNPSNPFVGESREEGIEHLDGVWEFSWGTIAVPLRTKEETAREMRDWLAGVAPPPAFFEGMPVQAVKRRKK